MKLEIPLNQFNGTSLKPKDLIGSDICLDRLVIGRVGYAWKEKGQFFIRMETYEESNSRKKRQ